MGLTNSEINGLILLFGIFIASIGAWIVWSFGISLLVLGGGYSVAALIANGDDKDDKVTRKD